MLKFQSAIHSHVTQEMGHFETSKKPNDAKMALNTEKSNVFHIDITTTPESQIHSVSL